MGLAPAVSVKLPLVRLVKELINGVANTENGTPLTVGFESPKANPATSVPAVLTSVSLVMLVGEPQVMLLAWTDVTLKRIAPNVTTVFAKLLPFIRPCLYKLAGAR